jgi:hypothetical protein
LTVPNSPLEITATFPAPPRLAPATASAASVKKRSRPPWDITLPKATKRKMKVAETSVGMPKIPWVVMVCWSTRIRNVSPPWPTKPGSHGPANA